MPETNSEFKPYQPEKRYIIEVTASEAFAIKSLREFGDFGEFILFKQSGKIIRIEPKKSELVTPAKGDDAALALGGKLVI
jgi:hypothetical protein